MKKAILLCLLSFFVLLSFSQEKSPLIPTNYDLKLSFNFEESTLSGICEIQITNTSDTILSEIPLLLYRLMNIQSVTDKSGNKLDFNQHVTQFDDFKELQVNSIIVTHSILPKQTETLIIGYNGYLLGYVETGMRYITDRISPEFTLIRNDAYSYPVLAKPSIAFLRKNLIATKFDYELKVSVPDSLVVANGGILLSKTEKEDITTYHYKSKKPGYRIDIAIAPYKIIHSDYLNVFYNKDSIAAQNITDSGNKAFSLYNKWWGKLQGNNTITIIETEKGSGGQTDETTILLPAEAFTNKNNYQYLYHEISHLWNVRIEDKGLSPRWEEGLATFCQYLASEHLDRDKEGLVKRAANRTIDYLNTAALKDNRLSTVPLIEYGNQGMTDYSYDQGLVMFAILYYWLGEDTFNKAIGGFYQHYWSREASTADFIDFWQKTVKAEQLRTFFNDWVYTTDYLKLMREQKDIDDIVSHYKSHH